MASNGRNAAGDRDKPPIKDVITASGDGADQDRPIANTITTAKPMGQVTGSGLPHIENSITCAKENS